MATFAAVERVYFATCEYAKAHNMPLPDMPRPTTAKPCRQIEIIKLHIMSIVPETHFIDYTYEAPVPLNPNDFIEVYVEDHKQCIDKVYEVMDKLRII
jgi:hypothetical protein